MVGYLGRKNLVPIALYIDAEIVMHVPAKFSMTTPDAQLTK